jgi:spermidine synthase
MDLFDGTVTTPGDPPPFPKRREDVLIPWVHLGSARVPDGDGELRLMRRGSEYSIMTGGIELMNSRMSRSEQALATLACDALAGRSAPRVLIGGLGMGFTLRAALEVLPTPARVVVAELVPAVVEWARGPMAEIFGDCLTDPRVALEVCDVGQAIRAADAVYDAILLDVDNGPGGLDREANDSLYAMDGLRAARRALTAQGVLAVWSSAPDEAFSHRLEQAGFDSEAVRVNAHRKGRGARHIIWLARSN